MAGPSDSFSRYKIFLELMGRRNYTRGQVGCPTTATLTLRYNIANVSAVFFLSGFSSSILCIFQINSFAVTHRQTYFSSVNYEKFHKERSEKRDTQIDIAHKFNVSFYALLALSAKTYFG